MLYNIEIRWWRGKVLPPVWENYSTKVVVLLPRETQAYRGESLGRFSCFSFSSFLGRLLSFKISLLYYITV